MTKKDLANILHKTLGINLNEASKIVDKFFQIIIKNLVNGEDVKLPKFGSIKIQNRKPRKGRKPTTGEPIDIAERKAIIFRPSKILKQKLNSSSDSNE